MASHFAGSLVASTAGKSGPSVSNQGVAIADPRTAYANGAAGAGQFKAFLPSYDTVVVNAAPSAAGAAKIAAAATAVSGTAMTLVSAAAAGIAPNTPMLPFGASSSSGVLRLLALDPGFATAATTAASASITMSSVFARVQPGTTLAIACGASATWQLFTVLTVSGTTVTLDKVAGATLAAAPVAMGNPANNSGTQVLFNQPYVNAGIGSLFDDRSAVARGVSVTSNNAADTGWTVTIRGYDLYGYPVTEALAVAANAVAYGVKTFKYITSVTPTKGGGGSSTGTLSIGTSDSFGLALRADNWETMTVFYAGALITASTGFSAADATSPATGTTGDARGRVQIGTIGPLGSGVSGGATDGSKRLLVSTTLTVDNLTSTYSSNAVPMFGVAHFAG